MLALSNTACTPQPEIDETGSSHASAISGVAAHDALVLSCSGCHGVGGSAIIALEGLGEAQIAAGLLRYRAEPEGTTVMHRLVRGYTEQDLRDISQLLGADAEQDDP